MKQPPCLNCICLAICKHRLISELLHNCPLVIDYTEFAYSAGPFTNNRYYYESENYNFDKLVEVYQTIRPTRWTLK